MSALSDPAPCIWEGPRWGPKDFENSHVPGQPSNAWSGPGLSSVMDTVALGFPLALPLGNACADAGVSVKGLVPRHEHTEFPGPALCLGVTLSLKRLPSRNRAYLGSLSLSPGADKATNHGLKAS